MPLPLRRFPGPLPPPPERLPDPFLAEPAPAARAAAALLQAELGDPTEGKMYGVLVVRDAAGSLGWLAAFSGMRGGQWRVPGFADPLFEPAALAAFWPAGEAELGVRTAAIQAARAVAEGPRRALAAAQAAQGAQWAALTAMLSGRKAARQAARAAGAAPEPLAQASRGDKALRRRVKAEHKARLAPWVAVADGAQATVAHLEAARAARSTALQARIHGCYTVRDFTGAPRALAPLYPQQAPPAGAGDCAAPKLLAAAQALGATPLALAEFWWGPPSPSGDRRHGRFYPPCRGKCAPLLPAMLRGVTVDHAPQPGATPPAALPVVYEDRWLWVVDKPAGLLSVPGRDAALGDSVQARLGHPPAHRLDLDTSGLLVVGRSPAVHAALQGLFAARRVQKRYLAVVEGHLTGSGVIELALRGDPLDRPRQVVDAAGKPARTGWHALAQAGGATRLALAPHTGRTHQLRVHCAHPHGLNAPIRGDRLYGTPADRLHLHAESLAFEHPVTGAPLSVSAPAPF